jgi:hypothetical protein
LAIGYDPATASPSGQKGQQRSPDEPMEEWHRSAIRRVKPRSEDEVRPAFDDRRDQIWDPTQVIGEVGIGHYNDLTFGCIETRQQCVAVTRTGFLDDPRTGRFRRFNRGIGGTVVDNDDLACKVSRNEAIYRFANAKADRSLLVEARQYHRDLGLSVGPHSTPLSPPKGSTQNPSQAAHTTARIRSRDALLP